MRLFPHLTIFERHFESFASGNMGEDSVRGGDEDSKEFFAHGGIDGVDPEFEAPVYTNEEGVDEGKVDRADHAELLANSEDGVLVVGEVASDKEQEIERLRGLLEGL